MKKKSTNQSAPWWLWACRIFVGLLFIFSGLIKINDPLGFSYKLQEYFAVFHIMFLNSWALAIAIVLCSLEITLGFALLIGVRPIKIAWGLLLLIIFFAFLTFYSAFFHVVETCGCFGDAVAIVQQGFVFAGADHRAFCKSKKYNAGISAKNRGQVFNRRRHSFGWPGPLYL